MLTNSVKNTVNKLLGDLPKMEGDMNVSQQRSSTHRKYKSLSQLVGAFLFFGLLTGCAQNPVSGGQDFVLFGEDKELEMGRAYHPQIIEQYGRYEDEALQRYVENIGQKLVKQSHRPELVYRFTVLDSPVINAFALPGGYIYITRGLMAYLGSEAELAAVLGHEIGHVTARHGVRQQSASQAANLGYTLGAILLPGLRTAGAQDIFNMMGGALLSGYGREHELESDRLGAEYLARTGYDPDAMIEVIGVLKDQSVFAQAQARKQGIEPQGYHGVFASHPNNDTRLQEAVRAADKYMGVEAGTHNREAYLAKIDDMVFGDSAKQGIRSGRNFYHPDLQFALTFPQNWQIQNSPSSLQAVAPEGRAFIQMGVSDLNRQQTPQQFIADRLKITRLSQGQTLSSNGLQGYTGLTQQQGKSVRVAVIYLADKAYVFIGSSQQSAQFKQFDSALLETIKSLHPLRADERKFAQPQRIEVVRTTSADSYQKWAQASHISNSPKEQLQLLNGDYPAGEIKAGALMKRVP